MAEMFGSLKVDNGVRRIKVNDAGEYIELSLTDVTLLDRFTGLMEWYGAKRDELNRFDADLKQRHAEDTDSDGAVIEVIHKRTEVYTEFCRKLDEVFGDGCCRKVFGNVIPDEIPIIDFLEQITPIMNRMAVERGERLKARYSGNLKHRGKRRSRGKQRTKEELISAYQGEAVNGAKV